MRLRDYQKEAITNTEAVFRDNQSALMVMATGLGKTITFAHAIKGQSGRSMVVAHREELIRQAQDKIKAVTGLYPDIEMAGEWANRMKKYPVVCATVQTLTQGRYADFDPNDFSLLVVDESHHSTAKSYVRVINHFKQNPNCKILGVTATPNRADEAALGQVYDDVSFNYGIFEGVNNGWLVPVKVRQVFVKSLDISGVSERLGDLANNELAQILEFEENLHGIADPLVNLVGEKKTLVFTQSVAQAERLSEIINRHKPGSSNWICGKTPKDVRAELLTDYKKGKYQFLVNVGVFTEGYDEPGIEVIAHGRPTKSECLYVQMTGRGCRPDESIAYKLNEFPDAEARRELIAQSAKPHVEVIDFVGNCGRHKLVSAADVLGGKYSDEIVEAVTRKVALGEPVDVMTELQKAEAEIAKRNKELVEAAARSVIKMKAAFAIKDQDPFEVLGIARERIPGYYKDREPSSAMKRFLKARNIDATELSFTHAGQLIGEIKSREKGLMPFGKHYGTPLDQVPKGYMRWALDKGFLNEELKAMFENILYGKKVG